MVEIFDGGLGTELAKIVTLDSKLWSGGLLLTNPQLIQDLHEKYVKAGAKYITTASYQTSYSSLRDEGLGAKSEEIWATSLKVAQEAAKLAEGVKVMASIGPYGSYVNDGSEYTGQYDISLPQLIEFHRPMVDFWNKSEADIIIFETVPNPIELQAILSLAITKPYIISFRVNDLMTIEAINKTSFTDALAIGINCVDYKDITEYYGQLTSTKNVVVYPNYGYQMINNQYQSTPEPSKWEECVKQWISLGIWGIGGCCSTSPEEIAIISKLLT
ncbi:homocysteine S-methyltransferase 1 [[Candida] jaroonii]|uniref:Homocysteine S-methyltransferase 1 n=1 Tax=[Candida] jaroonii TaxID=467808 RepID=A0ACA9Y7E1_9ASCO|nr:homocysteine S-methyltransferase 1 [[Candida] jaroonii]